MRRSRGILLLSAAFLFSGSGCGPQPSLSKVKRPPVETGFGWRGNGSGVFAGATPPVRWSPELNIRWRTPLPALSNASPVIAGERVFVCAEPFTLLCLNAETGNIEWSRTNSYVDLLPEDQHQRAEGQMEEATTLRVELQKIELKIRRSKKHPEEGAEPLPEDSGAQELEQQAAGLKARLEALREFDPPPTQMDVNGYSTPTPVTDGKHIWALFGNGVVACYSLDGERQWARVVEKPAHDFGQSSSPLLADGKLLVLVEKLHAIDAASGRTIWEAPAKQRWGSLQLLTLEGEALLVLPRGEVVRLADGRVLTTKSASVEHASPVVSDDTAFYIEGKAHAVRFSASPKPDKLDRRFIWNIDLPGERYFSSPVAVGDLIFALSQAGDLSVIDAAKGSILAQRQLGTAKGVTFYPSLVAADGKVFATSDDGTTTVLTADRAAAVIAVNKLAPIRSSLVFDRDRIYARALDALWCVGE